ncbi:RNA 2',3'-cyclic phosphodiesterase [Candidatus Thorarchaeota archaeon]|nr:MAG: RNA 2',3'-cyclic phosphodiesterase [Candidatus Thorarchaeota archaeon]
MVSEAVRAFLSIDITDQELLSRIEKVQERLDTDAARMKLVEIKNIHYTMRFLGDTQLNRIHDIKTCLEEVQFNPFEIEVFGVGAFPNIRRPRVIWVGAGQNENQISQLKREIDNSLKKLGYQLEKKYTPHATIARVRYIKDSQRISLNLEDLARESIGMMTVSQVTMKKSILTPSGPIYETLWKIPIK